MKKIILILGLSVQSLAFATSPPEQPMPNHPGAELFKENCTSCHFHNTPELFTRSDRKANTRAELSTWVSNCITQTGVDVFPEDEGQIESFLDDKYYKFKK